MLGGNGEHGREGIKVMKTLYLVNMMEMPCVCGGFPFDMKSSELTIFIRSELYYHDHESVFSSSILRYRSLIGRVSRLRPSFNVP